MVDEFDLQAVHLRPAHEETTLIAHDFVGVAEVVELIEDDGGQRGDLLAALNISLPVSGEWNSAVAAKASATARMSRLSLAARMDDPADTFAIRVIGSAPLSIRLIYCHN